jgi:hypothetical protein
VQTTGEEGHASSMIKPLAVRSSPLFDDAFFRPSLSTPSLPLHPLPPLLFVLGS